MLQIININKIKRLSISASLFGKHILYTTYLTLKMKHGFNELFNHFETDLKMAFVQFINFEIIIFQLNKNILEDHCVLCSTFQSIRLLQ